MAIKSLETTNFGNWETEKTQSNLTDFTRQIEKFPLFNGILHSDISLPGGDVQFAHKLGRKPTGYITTKSNDDIMIFSSSAPNDTNDKTIKLTTSAPVVVDLWIF